MVFSLKRKQPGAGTAVLGAHDITAWRLLLHDYRFVKVGLTISITFVNIRVVYKRNRTMKIPAITDAEAQVMETLWRKSPQSTEDIAAALAERQNWQMATIKTLLNRLLNKGAIGAEKEGRRYLYSAVLRRAEWQRTQSADLVDRVFGGSVAPLVAHFSQHRKLTESDVAALKTIIAAYQSDKGGHDV